eukprot:106547-Ditylum_brightwellii.AAC.1
MSNGQLDTLKDEYLITMPQDLALLDKADVNSILYIDKNTFVMRKKLNIVAGFIWRGCLLTVTTTIQTILAWLESSKSSLNSSAGKPKVTALIKLSPSNFPTFLGEILDQEHYKTKAEAQIDQEEKEHDEELFNILKNSFHGGNPYNVITSSLQDEHGDNIPPSTGCKVWTNFLTWCNSGVCENTPIKNLKNDLKNLKLDGDSIDGLSM